MSVPDPRHTVAYQGVPGAFSEVAARALAREGDALLPCASFGALFDALEQGRARCAAAPVENTLAGSVHECQDLLASRDVTVTGETLVRVSHALIGPPRSTLAGVRRVLSHPVALLQCERFFHAHPHIEAVPVFDTAGAVERVVREGEPSQAAIAAERAAALYGGHVLARELEDHADNFTRFLRIERRDGCAVLDPRGKRKALIVFRTRNLPGALHRCLGPFAARGIDLTKIESRPLKDTPFEYLFYMEVVAESPAGELDEAIAELEEQCLELRRLGTFEPAGPPA